MNFKTNKF